MIFTHITHSLDIATLNSDQNDSCLQFYSDPKATHKIQYSLVEAYAVLDLVQNICVAKSVWSVATFAFFALSYAYGTKVLHIFKLV